MYKKFSDLLCTKSSTGFKLKRILCLSGMMFLLFAFSNTSAQLRAGVAKINITNPNARGNITDTLYVKALVMKSGNTSAVIITVDAVAIGGIGSINNDYFTSIRAQIKEELDINPQNVLVNASHLHGAGYNISEDVEELTLMAVRQARSN